MLVLPILWEHEPTEGDWAALQRAKAATGYTDLVQPVRAVPGSPGRVLAVGSRPDWLTEYFEVADTSDPMLEDAMRWILFGGDDIRAMNDVAQLSMWFGGPVTLVGEEEYSG